MDTGRIPTRKQIDPLVGTFIVTAIVFVLAMMTLGGCGGVTALDASEGLAELERATGHPWTGRFHRDTGTPAWLTGTTTPLAQGTTNAAKAARTFIAAHATLFGLGHDGDDLRAEDAVRDELGQTHVRLEQTRRGIPVADSDFRCHFDRDGRLVRMNGRLLPLGEIEEPAELDADRARRVAAAEARAMLAASPEDSGLDPGSLDDRDIIARAPTLAIHPGPPARLAWIARTETLGTIRPRRLELCIDAIDGRVLERRDILSTVTGSGRGVFGQWQTFGITERRQTYWMEDGSRGVPPIKTYSMRGRKRLPGGQVRSTDPARWDDQGPGAGAAVDAHAYAAAAYDYFAAVHGRLGWDGKATGPHVAVHFGQGYANAFFDGRTIVFGDGDGVAIHPLAGAPDVVAHEYSHGIIAGLGDLTPQGESGAIGEGLADVFGVLIEGRIRGTTDWTVGELIHRPRGQKQPLRDLAHPERSDNPCHFSERSDSPEDNGAIHANSTLVSHAAYLLSRGGQNLVSGHRVEDIGPIAVERILYRTLAHYVTRDINLRDFAEATVAAAHDLDPILQEPVRQAWRAMGIWDGGA